MPSLATGTEAVFTSLGVEASVIYGVFTSLIATAISFGLWLIQVSWPFLLGLSFIYLMWKLARKFLGLGR